ncbi:MAG: periplasmic heavy metal sensor [Phenylobacterium sp.]|uniref:periplasmic heavy metal sensor n=1 Tax=Phenylobacterium sp. TaxID=1871053 RepID=UPI003918E40F
MSRRVLLIVLFVSLALNLFVAGAVVGGLVAGGRTPHASPSQANPRPGPALWAAGEALPPDRRREFRRLLREQGPVTNQRLREVRQARREAWLMLGKEPFDPVAASRALDAARQAEIAARRDVEHRVVEFAARLPPDERARFAQSLAPPAPDPGARRGHRERP